jgi:general secretion pathway protein M
MTDWFESLDARERLIVASGAVFVVLALIYALAWAPLDKKHAERRTEVDIWQRAIAELRPLRVQPASGQQAGSAPANNSRQTPITIVDQTLRSRGLDSYRRGSKPISSNGIMVDFEDVAFDELILWLGDLSEQYGMHVQIASFSTNSQMAFGRTNASVTLERAL